MDTFTANSPHRPLSPTDPSEIRLVTLKAGSFDGEINCRLKHVSLQPPGRLVYFTLSYTWGDPNVTYPIFLDGRPYPVTINLASFLRHMQSICSTILPYFPSQLLLPNDNARVLRHHLFNEILKDLEIQPGLANSNWRYPESVRRHFEKMIQATRVAWAVDEFCSDLDDGIEPELSLNFWIDAICINQQDLSERSVQVARMSDIYSRATSLFIWLGDATSDSDTNDVMGLAYHLHKVTEPFIRGDIEWSVIEEHIREASLVDTSRTSWVVEKLRDVLRRDWFERIWIVQEVAVSNSSTIALLGSRTIPWDFLTHIVHVCCFIMADVSGYGAKVMFQDDTKNLAVLRDIKRGYLDIVNRSEALQNVPATNGVPERLYDLLRQTSGQFVGSDPRDLLYALLGLVGTGIPSEITPDYTLSVSQVYHQYTRYLITGNIDLAFLHFIKREVVNVPSWVPDWRYVGPDTPRSFAKCLGPWKPKVSEDGKCLVVSVIRIGEVVRAVHPSVMAADIQSAWAAVDSSPNSDEQMMHIRRRERRVLTIFQKLQELKRLCLEHINAVKPNVSRDFVQHWRSFLDMDNDKLRLTFEMLETETELRLEQIMKEHVSFQLHFLGQRFTDWTKSGIAILANGGLATIRRIDTEILEGDLVCQLGGMSRPCILRPSGECFNFVSACDGISMKLEVETGSEGEYHWERFELIRNRVFDYARSKQ